MNHQILPSFFTSLEMNCSTEQTFAGRVVISCDHMLLYPLVFHKAQCWVLFCYTSSLSKVTYSADATQLIVCFLPLDSISASLLDNLSKKKATIAARQNVGNACTCPDLVISLENSQITLSYHAPSLGVVLDNHLSLTPSIANLITSRRFLLNSMKRGLDISPWRLLGRCFVISRLDHCNSLPCAI